MPWLHVKFIFAGTQDLRIQVWQLPQDGVVVLDYLNPFYTLNHLVHVEAKEINEYFLQSGERLTEVL